SQVGDEAIIAEAKKRFAEYVKNPSSLAADMRRNVLDVVAFNADAQIWDQLHALAKTTNDTMQKTEYYTLLGLAQDKALAQKALDLALTEEAPITVRPTIAAAVSNWYPEMAFDFVVAHLDRFNAMLEPDSRNQFEVRLAGNSYEPSMIPKVRAYAQQHIPPTARQSAVKAEAAIAYYAQIRAKHLQDIDRWLSHRRGS
ncbi:MAG: ERAP1-like C-terminal domain-containing protein, partial [Candidatus Binatia bacterium]